ncbi:MAG: hypothetical protein IT285_07155 [Bdellovibrionales bacterium]|nr:hypothetical protein [Bdellovibrionales bacterium]
MNLRIPSCVRVSRLTPLFLGVLALAQAGCPGPDPEDCEEPVPAEIAPPIAVDNFSFSRSLIADPDTGRVAFSAKALSGTFANHDAMIWNGTAWERRAMSTGTMIISLGLGPLLHFVNNRIIGLYQFNREGDPVFAPRSFLELDAGGFTEQYAQPEPLEDSSLRASGTDGTQLILASGIASNQMRITETAGNGTWARSTVATGSGNLEGTPLAVGYTAEGVPWLVLQSPIAPFSIQFTRRTGSVWTTPINLATPGADESLLSREVFQTPVGSAQNRLYLSFVRWKSIAPASTRFQTVSVDLSSFVISPSQEVFMIAESSTVYSNVGYWDMAFDFVTGDGVYAIKNPSTDQVTLGKVEGPLLSQAVDVIAPTAIEGHATFGLYYDVCRKPVLAHRPYPVGGSYLDHPIRFRALEATEFDGI